MAITISDTEPRVQYTATSGQTSFTVGFEFFDNADLKVYNGTTLLSYAASPADATEYSVSGAGQSGGGSITLGSPGATLNDTITIYRDLAISRSTDFPTSGAFQIDSLNTELDKIIAMCQQLERDLKFSPRAAATTSNTYDITFPNMVADKVLTSNSDGTALEFSVDKTDVTTVAGIKTDVTTVSGISSNVTTVAGAVTNINTVASNITNVNTVANNIADIITVANDLNEAVSEIETVASDLQEASPEIDTVATNITNVNSVGNNISDINTVAGISSNVTTVAGISANITTVAGITSNITTVATNDTNITSVASNITNINSVASNSTNINAVAGNETNINAVNTNSSNINTVAGANTNISTVAGAITNVNTVATNISGVNSFAERYRIASSAPGSDNDIGDLYFDTTADELKVYKSSGWAAAGSTVNGTSARFTYTISGTPTSVSGSDDNGETLAYDAGFADVYVNGVRMSSADITITSGTSVVFASALTDGDVVDIVAYGTFDVASIDGSNITSGTISNSRLTGNGAITINGSAVSLGGSVTIGETKPTVSSVSPSTITNAQTSVTITGTNFNTGIHVEAVSSTGTVIAADTISRTNSTTLVCNFTIATDATYFIRVENTDGNAARSSTAILTVSDAPTWTTSAGSLGSVAAGDSVSFSVAATSDSTVAYSETTSVLTSNTNTPAGTMNLSLNSSTGAITGTAPSPTSETTYNFTLRATDNESQTADRAFSITVTVGINNGGQFN